MPQGTILGPILFLFYVNGMPNNISTASSLMYADDTSIYCSSNNTNLLQSKLQGALNSMSEWLTANRLVVNAQKSQFFKHFHLPAIELMTFSNQKSQVVNPMFLVLN